MFSGVKIYIEKKETIDFIINYSKSLNILKLNSHNFEFIMN